MAHAMAPRHAPLLSPWSGLCGVAAGGSSGAENPGERFWGEGRPTFGEAPSITIVT